eukprot:1783695-Prymnesium_polylepis.2
MSPPCASPPTRRCSTRTGTSSLTAARARPPGCRRAGRSAAGPPARSHTRRSSAGRTGRHGSAASWRPSAAAVAARRARA